MRKVFTQDGTVVAVSEVGSVDSDVTYPGADHQFLTDDSVVVAVGYLFDGTAYTAPPVLPDPPPTVQQIEDALTAYFDSVAQSKRYDNRVTCALRAGYVGPFQAEGLAFAQWMDACNALGYQLLAEVQATTRPMPDTLADALALLPAMVWPE